MSAENDNELDWDRDQHGGMADYATNDEPVTVCAGDGDEEGDD